MIKEVSQWQYLREKYPKQDAIRDAVPPGSWLSPVSLHAPSAVLCTCLTECARSAAATMAVRSKLSSPWRRSKRQLLALGGKKGSSLLTFCACGRNCVLEERRKLRFVLAYPAGSGYNTSWDFMKRTVSIRQSLRRKRGSGGALERETRCRNLSLLS